jgi:predicted nucleic acid-binding protein
LASSLRSAPSQRPSGTSCNTVDGQIAAIALLHNLTLVTRNVRDFAHFAGLNVEDWK